MAHRGQNRVPYCEIAGLVYGYGSTGNVYVELYIYIYWQTLGTLNTRMRVLLKNVPIKVAKCCEMRCHSLVLSIPRA